VEDEDADRTELDEEEELEKIVEDLLESTGFTLDLQAIDAGVFTVGGDGLVGIDFLYDGGGYKGQLAIFSLEGLDGREFESFDDFIAETVDRASSNSDRGYLVINDKTEGAKFASGENSGDYAGVKLFAMKAGDTFAVMLVPNSTLAAAADGESTSVMVRPLYSLSTANPDDELHVAQIADVTGDGSTFVMEDMSTETKTDRDYNDIVFRVTGATGEAVTLDEVIGEELGEKVRELLSEEPASEEPVTPPVNETPTQPEEPVTPPVNETPTQPEEPVTPPVNETPTEPEEPVTPPVNETPTEPEKSGATYTPALSAWEEAIKRASDLSTYDPEALANTTQWLVSISEGQSPEELAASLGAQYIGESEHIAGTYILEFSEGLSASQVSETLNKLEEVGFSVPLVAQEAVADFTPNDKHFNLQWHLKNTGQLGGTSGEDSNVTPAWNLVKGKGVVIGIVDDGVDEAHEDLDGNYRADLSKDFVGGTKDDDHGTPVAGIVAAEGNNGTGVSGVAPEASVADLRKLGKSQTDSENAAILSHKYQEIDIYQNSWSPSNSLTLAGPYLQTLKALSDGVATGRDGLGNIYVFSAGNNRQSTEDGHYSGNDNVNNNGYANSRFTIAVGAIDDKGTHSSYSEPGAALFVAAHSDGNGGARTASTGSDGKYVYFGGTSSAAPLVSGIIALMLEANPNLTWRDVQHILAKTARKNDSSHFDWSVNGAGYNVNHFYGFGAVDATAAVNAAKTWKTVADEISHTTGEMKVNATIPDNSSSGISRTINVQQDIQLESVEVVFDADHYSRGDLEIVLTSPDGTESILAEQRPDEGDNYTYWVFNTVRNWGESSKGNWTLRVADKSGGQVGTWDSWKLNFYGTEAKPAISTISVTTPDGEAAETNLGELSNPAKFVVSRSSGDNSKAEKVYYSVTGTATSGEDYAELAGFVTIPAGQDSVPVTINPLNDTKYEELENVIFRLESRDSYKLGSVVQGVATIASNDDKPVSKISITTLDKEAAETKSGETPNTAVFAISRSGGDNAKAETIRYSIVLRDKDGNIYNTIAGTQVIPAGSTQAIVTFKPIDDATYDGTESIHFEVTSDPNYQLGGQTMGSATLLDNDAPPKSILNVSAVETAAYEAGSAPAQFRITRSGGDNSKAEIVYYGLTGTATQGTDYQFLSGVTQIPAGATETFVTVTPIDDSIYEGTENVTFTVQNSNDYILGSSIQDSIAIVDNDPKPISTITVEVEDGTATEAVLGETTDPAKFIIWRSGGDNSKAEDVYYTFELKDKDGKTYYSKAGVKTISAGFSGLRIPFTPLDDFTYDGTETMVFTVTADPSYKLGSTASGTAKLYDNEEPPKSTLSVATTDATAKETAWYESPDPAIFTVTRSGGDNSKAETVYYTVGGTAENGTDYVKLAGIVEIPAGQTSAVVTLLPQDDSTYEELESVTFSVSSHSSYELGETTTGTATIEDNDIKPISTITLEVEDAVASETLEGEEPNPAKFKIHRSGGDTNQAETIYYVFERIDKDGIVRESKMGVTTISAGFTSRTVSLTPQDDSVYEGTQTITFKVTSDPNYQLGATISGTAILLDNELPPRSTISVRTLDAQGTESGNQMQFQISRSGGDLSQAETVSYTLKGTAQNGVDYEYLSGFVTIPAGLTSAIVTVNPIDDTNEEATESLIFEVSSSNEYELGSSFFGEAMILDNEQPELNYQAPSFWEFDREWPDQSSDKSYGSVVDADGNFYVVMGDLINSKVRKVSPSGDLLWEKKLDQSLLVKHVAIKDNSLIIHDYGFTEPPAELALDINSGTLAYKETQVDQFEINPHDYDFIPEDLINQALEIAKSMSEDVNSQWWFAGRPHQDSDGNVYVTGHIDYNEILIKVNSDGTHAWTFIGDSSDYFSQGIKLDFDSDGNIYFLSEGAKSDLLTKLSSSGKVLWQSDIKEDLLRHGDSYYFSTLDMKVDAEGKVHLFGGRSNPLPHYDTGNYWTAVYAPVEKSSSTVLYDITFDEASQGLNQLPNATVASNTVSSIVFGDPKVQNASRNLTNRPLVFTDNQSGYDQIQLDVGEGFDQYSLSFELDAVQLNGDTMTVLLDTPGVRNIYFNPDGWVELYPFGNVGTFDLNGVNHVTTEINFEQDNWKLIINGKTLYNGKFAPSSNDLSSIRFSLGALVGQTNSVVAIDNIKLVGFNHETVEASAPPVPAPASTPAPSIPIPITAAP
jgi:subtilisin-like proprotein convertase family protein/outer membrane biosynthesis protein TonB